MNYKELIYWNSNKYGNAYKLHLSILAYFYLILAIIIPVIVPVPAFVLIKKWAKNKAIWIRY